MCIRDSPTAVRLTLGGFREAWPGKRIVAVFEPRSNTSQRAFFQEDYVKSFEASDSVILKAVEGDRGYSKSGDKIVSLDTDKLARDIVASGKQAIAYSSVEEIAEAIVSTKKKDDLIILMSNGDFGGLKGKLIDLLS